MNKRTLRYFFPLFFISAGLSAHERTIANIDIGYSNHFNIKGHYPNTTSKEKLALSGFMKYMKSNKIVYESCITLPVNFKNISRKESYESTILHLPSTSDTLESENILISKQDLWEYYDSLMPENEQWMSKFNKNIVWKSGYSEFGYGDGDETTVIGYGDDTDNKYITSYFRKKFHITSQKSFLAYLIRMKVDDGAIVYLNEQEIWRVNMPSGTVTGNTLSAFKVIDKNENKIHSLVLDAELLNIGTNIIAVSVHQSNASSSDCSFMMELVSIENVQTILRILSKKEAKLSEKLINVRDQMLINDKELEIKIKDQEIQLNRLYVNISIIIFIIIVVLFISLWYTTRRRSISIAKNNSMLKKELISTHQELINMSIGQLSKDRLIHDMEGDLSDEAKNRDSETLIHQLKRKISSFSVQDKEWENLQYHFENVHSAYFSKLKSDFPNLSATELRLCGFIKLELSTKEIARILSIEPRSVQTSRYRLKKKLNIPNHIDMIQFLSRY